MVFIFHDSSQNHYLMLGLGQNYNNHFHHFHDNDPLSAHVVVTFILPFQNHVQIICDNSDAADVIKEIEREKK